MFKPKRIFCIFAVSFLFLCNSKVFALEEMNDYPPHPDYSEVFLGQDKFEKFNRKMFNFNMKMNKYALRPINIIWASIMPKYGMDRISGIYDNVLYPRRLISNLVQKDFGGAFDETVRFVANSTVGLGGMFDPAKKYLKIESTEADMEQALAKYNVKSGPYVVCPILSSASPRALVGKALDAALDPSSYVGLPFISLAKLGFTINNTTSMQPMAVLIESTFADPYDIMRKLYGIENYLKTTPLVEKEVTKTMIEVFDGDTNLALENIAPEYLYEISEKLIGVNDLLPKTLLYYDAETELKPNQDEKYEEKIAVAEDYADDFWAYQLLALEGFESMVEDYHFVNEFKSNEKLAINPSPNFLPLTSTLEADVQLEGYNPQSPVVDAMRTALFDAPKINESAWSELSIWNRSFANRIKTASVKVFTDRADYKFRYIMQRDKNAPVAIIYPSIGEGIMSYHSVVLAKLFYDKGYSVIIQGSHFQWEFVKSMPEEYKPGLPSRDADYLRAVTTKIVNTLQNKYNCEFNGKVVIGTSFGAMTTLFLAEKESKENTLNISKYISINPPIELVYAMNQVDKNTADWNKNPDNLKERVAITASKVLSLLRAENLPKDKIEALPFSEEEAKLITGFIMHQKLSDLIYTIENGAKSDSSKLYEMIRGMNYREYTKKYLLGNDYHTIDDLVQDTSLHSICEYLVNNNNYKIYHAIDDYLVSPAQLAKLKSYCGSKAVYMSNGSHLGFLYRKEFIESLKKDIEESFELKEFTEGKV